jgi:hypothetical protein
MNRVSVVVVALVCSVLGMPQTTSAAGSYGAVVEKGVRDCTTDRESGVVVCFESHSVSSQSRDLFLQAWRSAHVSLARWDTWPAMLRVRAVSATAASPPSGRQVLTYLASADHVMPQLVCRDEFRFQGSSSVDPLPRFVSTCQPHGAVTPFRHPRGPKSVAGTRPPSFR